jgi:hypothetical protein
MVLHAALFCCFGGPCKRHRGVDATFQNFVGACHVGYRAGKLQRPKHDAQDADDGGLHQRRRGSDGAPRARPPQAGTLAAAARAVMVDRPTRETRPAWIFVAVLGTSSFTYAEATWTQGLGDWIGGHTGAFAAIEGCRG